jgi:hypothetical protein
MGTAHRKSCENVRSHGGQGPPNESCPPTLFPELRGISPPALPKTVRYFAGLTGKQAAEVLGISPTTADRHWA